MTQLNIEDTYGYIIIDTPEKKAKFGPKQDSDEIFFNGWGETNFRDGAFRPDNIYRRKIQVGIGFEFVGLDEKIREGDEYWDNSSEKWAVSKLYILDDETVREHHATRPEYLHHFRRPVKSNGWVKIKSGCVSLPDDPTKTLCLLWSDGDRTVWSAGKWNAEEVQDRTNGDLAITHWQYIALPEAPTPEKSPREMAFEKAKEAFIEDFNAEKFDGVKLITSGLDRRIRNAFDAGISFAQSKGAGK